MFVSVPLRNKNVLFRTLACLAIFSVAIASCTGISNAIEVSPTERPIPTSIPTILPTSTQTPRPSPTPRPPLFMAYEGAGEIPEEFPEGSFEEKNVEIISSCIDINQDYKCETGEKPIRGINVTLFYPNSSEEVALTTDDDGIAVDEQDFKDAYTTIEEGPLGMFEKNIRFLNLPPSKIKVKMNDGEELVLCSQGPYTSIRPFAFSDITHFTYSGCPGNQLGRQLPRP